MMLRFTFEKKWKPCGWMDKKEAERWDSAKWKDPKEARDWFNTGFLNPKEAKNWFDSGWNKPKDAWNWYSVGWGDYAKEALAWKKDSSMKPRDALNWFTQGWNRNGPSKDSYWYDKPKRASAYSKFWGGDADLDADLAAVWARSCWGAESSAKFWSKVFGSNVGLASQWFKARWDYGTTIDHNHIESFKKLVNHPYWKNEPKKALEWFHDSSWKFSEMDLAAVWAKDNRNWLAECTAKFWSKVFGSNVDLADKWFKAGWSYGTTIDPKSVNPNYIGNFKKLVKHPYWKDKPEEAYGWFEASYWELKEIDIAAIWAQHAYWKNFTGAARAWCKSGWNEKASDAAIWARHDEWMKDRSGPASALSYWKEIFGSNTSLADKWLKSGWSNSLIKSPNDTKKIVNDSYWKDKPEQAYAWFHDSGWKTNEIALATTWATDDYWKNKPKEAYEWCHSGWNEKAADAVRWARHPDWKNRPDDAASYFKGGFKSPEAYYRLLEKNKIPVTNKANNNANSRSTK